MDGNNNNNEPHNTSVISNKNSMIELEPMHLSRNMMYDQAPSIIIDKNADEPLEFENGWTAVQNDRFLSEAS